MPGHIDDLIACKRRFGDRADLAAGDADVPHGIETARRVHHAAIGEHEVVRRKWKRGGEEREDKAGVHEMRRMRSRTRLSQPIR
jgi:hypothetical protein